MQNIARLINLTNDEQAAPNAAVNLVLAGMPAVPHIVAAIKSNTGATWLLCEVLTQIRHSEIVPLLIELLQEKNRDLRITAFNALGHSGDARAIPPLLEALSTWKRNSAVRALGQLSNPVVIPQLLAMAKEIVDNPFAQQVIKGVSEVREEDFDRDKLMLLIDLVIALAKLGNYEVAAFILPLTRYTGNSIDANAFYIRKETIRALQYVAIPGMLPALQMAMRDQDTDVRLAAVDALFYLGVKSAISELFLHMQNDDPLTLNNVLVRIHGLTGVWPKEGLSPEELQNQLQQLPSMYADGVCYRLGRPLYIPNIVALLLDPNQVSLVMKELEIITGKDFGYNPHIPLYSPNELMALAQEWWKSEGHRFEPGALYKYGHKQELNNVF